ncbi:uncharacterized membrane protein (DUF485 family) [Erwinia toletana]|uniref:Uncharacterized membrane protein (DUF485 family) n=1 Tax=Winslowiella toletana TaxID=92490 RepID=A0ABS4PDI3_9GAMM|nr:conjugal transfer protein TraG N-terminal domain-containing protein [Winslowiella toletana]MBP2170706.1 uncharacterized membrane protein (DUF485 family) [Winslowiella toletana]
MTTNSYLEYFLTLLGWLVNNGIWAIISSTGLFAFPLLLRLISLWLKVRAQGIDEGNKGSLSLLWMENHIYTSLVVILFTCIPFLNIDLNTIKFDTSRTRQCGYSVPQPADTGYHSLINQIGGQTASVPVWWYLIHALAKGVTDAAVATLPCQPDLRQIRFEVQHTHIADPALNQEILDFAQECYSPSLARLKAREAHLSDEQSESTRWIGSSYFLRTPGFYDSDHAHSPHQSWPYNSSRDAGLFNSGNGGYPTCKQWWEDKEIGIRDRVLKPIPATLWNLIQRSRETREVYEESVLRSLVSQDNMQLSQDGRVYPGFGGNTSGSLSNAATRTLSTVGELIGSISAFPAFDSVRQALPMIQAILIMALIICFPLITLFSAYELKTIIMLSLVQFALVFLTFWWELARWLDSWLLYALYSSDAHSSWNFAGLQNSQDDIIINLVMGTMFVVLPVLWLGAISWAGVHIGAALSGVAASGTADVKGAGGKGSLLIKM